MKIKRKKRYVITDKKRFTLFLITVLILFCCGFSSIKSRTREAAIDMISVSVSSGDTLWKLAAAHNPDNKDIRSIVYKIKKLNNLSSDTIHSGDRIFIPLS